MLSSLCRDSCSQHQASRLTESGFCICASLITSELAILPRCGNCRTPHLHDQPVYLKDFLSRQEPTSSHILLPNLFDWPWNNDECFQLFLWSRFPEWVQRAPPGVVSTGTTKQPCMMEVYASFLGADSLRVLYFCLFNWL